MIFNSALADAKIRCNVLAGVAREHEVHDLVLPPREARDVARGGLLPSGPFV